MRTAKLTRVERWLRKPWYWMWRIVERSFYRGRDYTILVPHGRRVYTPWFGVGSDEEFDRAIRRVRKFGPLGVSRDRCYMLYQLLRRSRHLDGDVVECGVFTGGTAHLMACVLEGCEPVRRLHLFDTFSGMPASARAERDYHSPGQYSDTSLDRVKQRLKAFDFVEFHPGLMPDTFSELDPSHQFSFVHVDVDIYPSTMDCCTWLWPRISAGGVIVFDDYGFYPYRRAARAAVDQFFSQEKEQPLILPTGQALAIKY